MFVVVVFYLIAVCGGLEESQQVIETRDKGAEDFTDIQICGTCKNEREGVHVCWDCKSVGQQDCPSKVDWSKATSFIVKTNAQKHYARNVPLSFPTIASNVNGGFSTSTNKFKAPGRGRYLFTLSARTTMKQFCHPGIFKDGSLVGQGFVGHNINGWSSQASIQAVLDLDVGNTVYVADKDGRGGWYSEATFTGVFLYPL